MFSYEMVRDTNLSWIDLGGRGGRGGELSVDVKLLPVLLC